MFGVNVHCLAGYAIMEMFSMRHLIHYVVCTIFGTIYIILSLEPLSIQLWVSYFAKLYKQLQSLNPKFNWGQLQESFFTILFY
uniref:Uncharacterized protein n=1 Tax=Rhizophora mucronata TaxID=61149 RepID=A0A2P2L3M2_RHIMU